MRRHYPEIRRQKGELLIVTPGRGLALKRYGEELDLPTRPLADPKAAVYGRYGLRRGSLWRVWGPRTLLAYLKLLLRGRRLRWPQGDFYLLGGDFIIDQAGVLRYAYRSREPIDRPAIGELLTVLAQLAGEQRRR